MNTIPKSDVQYKQWLTDLKSRIRNSQIKAALKVNSELINLYWDLGKEIVSKQEQSQWGDGLIKQLSNDLQQEFPDMKGFSISNIKYIKQWYLFYYKGITIGQQVVGQLENTFNIQDLVCQIPWGHNLRIIAQCKFLEEAIFYIHKTIENGWSRSILDLHIKQQEFQRTRHSISNFSRLLTMIQSDLAQQLLKDPYNFDFLTLTDNYKERELEYTGKLSFYLTAVNDLLKHQTDNPTIGLLICKNKDSFIAEYSLKGISQPIGVSEYELTRLCPEDFKGSLPSIEEIEAELKE